MEVIRQIKYDNDSESSNGRPGDMRLRQNHMMVDAGNLGNDNDFGVFMVNCDDDGDVLEVICHIVMMTQHALLIFNIQNLKWDSNKSETATGGCFAYLSPKEPSFIVNNEAVHPYIDTGTMPSVNFFHKAGASQLEVLQRLCFLY